MNIDNVKVYSGFLASATATILDVETILKITVLSVTIIYTIFKIIELQEKRRRDKKNDDESN